MKTMFVLGFAVLCLCFSFTTTSSSKSHFASNGIGSYGKPHGHEIMITTNIKNFNQTRDHHPRRRRDITAAESSRDLALYDQIFGDDPYLMSEKLSMPLVEGTTENMGEATQDWTMYYAIGGGIGGSILLLALIGIGIYFVVKKMKKPKYNAVKTNDTKNNNKNANKNNVVAEAAPNPLQNQDLPLAPTQSTPKK